MKERKKKRKQKNTPLKLKGEQKKDATEYGRFSITCSFIETRILAGDELVLLESSSPPNILLRRTIGSSMRTMRIVSDREDDFLEERTFTEEEVQLIVVVLAASLGLSFQKENPLDDGSITFKFLK